MNLKVGEEYITKCGNTVTCYRESDKGFWCRYLKVIVGHESLLLDRLNKQLWSKNGSWVKHPGGIHDIIKVI